jgi:opacity protein-like surface antigen
MTSTALIPLAVLALAFTAAAPAAAQTPKPPARGQGSTPAVPEAESGTVSGTGLGRELPGVLLPPSVGLDVLYAPPVQGRLVVTPSIAISEEFNDNIFLRNDDRQSDFITQFTPGLALAMREPGFQLTAGYNFTAEIFARHEELNSAANRQAFRTDATYRVSPVLTLTLTDSFAYSKNSNAASTAGISSGRQETWSNVVAPGLDLRLTPRTVWHVFGAYALERFGNRESQDSDFYRLGTSLEFAVTPRFSVTAEYDFGYLDIRGESGLFLHTPRAGVTYRIAPTLTAAVFAGPSFVVNDRDTNVTPVVTARLSKLATWGAMSLFYDRTVSTAGGFGGPNANQTFGGNVSASKLWRGLSLDVSPRYTMSKTLDLGSSRTDINALTLTLGASYQLARNIALIAAYTFFRQDGSGAPSGLDVDQNRVLVGLRFGYPVGVDVQP